VGIVPAFAAGAAQADQFAAGVVAVVPDFGAVAVAQTVFLHQPAGIVVEVALAVAGAHAAAVVAQAPALGQAWATLAGMGLQLAERVLAEALAAERALRFDHARGGVVAEVPLAEVTVGDQAGQAAAVVAVAAL